jgi:hypothetical protein
MHYVQVALHVTEVDVLVQMRFLKEEERHDPERLQAGGQSFAAIGRSKTVSTG